MYTLNVFCLHSAQKDRDKIAKKTFFKWLKYPFLALNKSFKLQTAFCRDGSRKATAYCFMKFWYPTTKRIACWYFLNFE